MDDIIQLVAIIVIIGISAASSLVKNFNKNQDDEEQDNFPIEPPMPPPQRPTQRPKPVKPMASTDGRSLEGRSLEGRSLETRPQRRRKPIQRSRPQTGRPQTGRPQPAPRQRQAPQMEDVYVEPLPQKEEKKDLVTEIFKAFMETEEPEIVMEPAPPEPKLAPKPKPKPSRTKSEPKSVKQKPMTPVQLAHLTTPTQAHHPLFSQLAKQAEANPLRVAVVLSEILKRPRSLPPMPRWSDRT